jgi:beta-lactamase regulating signal transducer with metallopeptidase domain
MSELTSVVLSWLGTYLLHSTLFLLAAWTLLRGRTPRRPRLAELSWRFALLAGILSASLQVASGTRPLLGSLSLAPASESAARESIVEEAQGPPLLSSEDAARAPASPAAPSRSVPPIAPSIVPPSTADEEPTHLALQSSRAADVPAAAEGSPLSSVEPAPAERPVRSNAAERADPLASAGVSPASPGDARAPWTAVPRRILDAAGLVLLSGWGSVALVGTILFTAALVRIHRRLRPRVRIESGPWIELLRELERRAGSTRRVRLSLSRTTESPLTIGWFRREIVLPERALASLTPRQIESMLAHELAHATRNDPVWFSIYALCERVLFFQPLNRLARRELHDAAELLCDDWAVRWTGHRLALASCLAEVAHWIVGRKRLPVPAMADRRSRLRIRIERLLDDRRSPLAERSPRAFLLVAGLTLGLGVLALPGVTSAAPGEPTPSPAPKGRNERLSTRPVRLERPVPVIRSAPEPSEAEPVSAGPAELLADHAHLEVELSDLEREIDALSSELAELGLADRLGCVVDELRAKLAALRQQHALLSALLGRAFPNGTPHTTHEPESIPRKSP